jgi:KAP family P-loop domain
VTFWDAESGKPLSDYQPDGPLSEWGTISQDGSMFAATRDGSGGLVRIEQLSSYPRIKAIASSSNGLLWIVGSSGYAASSRDGLNWTNVKIGDNDFIAVAALGSEKAVALVKNNALEFFDQPSAPTLASIKETAIKPAPTSGRSVEIPSAGNRQQLRALAFINEKEGWAAGDDGLILHTADGGVSWTALHGQDGLSLADLVIEPSGVGWAVGKFADGRLAVVAADKASAATVEGGWRTLPHFVGPWFFIFGIPALLLAAFLILRAWQSEPAPSEESIEEIATSDMPLRWNDPNSSTLKPLARSLSRFLRNVNTRPPLTLAITGRWGSGKSSLMSLLMSNLQYHGGRAVWFNAWHHREEEHLLAALFEAIRREAPPGWWSWPGAVFRARLMWRRSRRLLLNLAYAALFIGIVALTVRVALPMFHAEELHRMFQGAVGLVGEEVAKTWEAMLALALAGSGGLALSALWLRGKLVALPANPAKLAAALTRRASLGDFSEKLAFRHRFGEQFGDVCNALLTRTSPGLVILIDDLDRCQPDDVLKILEAINYLVSAGPCTVVLGMDRRQIEYCVGIGFEKLVEGLPEDELIYAADETSDKSGKQRAFARHYLEKLINIEVPIPALDENTMGSMLVGTTRAIRDDVDGPSWLQGAKQTARNIFQIARVGLLAFIVGTIATWSAERLRDINPPAISTALRANSPNLPKAERLGTSSASPAIQAEKMKEPMAGFAVPARVDLQTLSPTQEIPAPRRWIWWTPTILLVGFASLFGATAVAHRQHPVIEDSPAFTKALLAVKPLFTIMNSTPRAIKRYQNRMRYLAARLRPEGYEPDRIDSALHWLGIQFGWQLVPAEWFNEQARESIEESALILLGAIEVFAPKTYSNPAELFTKLESATPGDRSSDEQSMAWAQVRGAFVSEGLPMPTLGEIVRYAAFVQNKARAMPSHAGDVVQLHRDPTTGPRSA